MNCPNCGHSVSNVRKTWDRNHDDVGRRRECRVCGHRFSTTERLDTRKGRNSRD